ncbi:TerB family tellurite resistance protein [Longitalea arenae]|uniref:tellurite resistance TerB family protein n=1 Tax=Longitalea arenae TaxID=2812558 RepID=UPI001967A8BD|nr:TerB family tellurite resistance protein [Longitalea arenae]
MYTGLLKAPEEGICHLFYYCCMKDGAFKESELDIISDKMVSLDIHKKLNFRDEMQKYKSYKDQITDEEGYLKYLISIIKPTHTLALFSWCLELCTGDNNISFEEEQLLSRIARLLNIGDTEKELLQRAMIQRSAVLKEKEF